MGDRPPDTALHAIALPSSKIAQLSPYIENFSSSCTRTCAGAIAPIHVRMDMYTVYNLISTFVDNHA
ncbi:MAG: hypothetical protein KME57_20605 [Scytonema hyalinum WJT4-NPBG1]|nr:hypothetical protein [Scytonema hyalinum WJT4-NPBG1]